MLTPAAEIRSGAGATGPAPAHVTVRGLCKRFGATTIYHDFDLDIPFYSGEQSLTIEGVVVGVVRQEPQKMHS